MKKSIFSLATFLFLTGLSSFSFGQSAIEASFVKRAENEVSLRIVKPAATELRLLVLDQNGNIVHRGLVGTGAKLRLRLDLSHLRPGNYTYQIFDGQELIGESLITKSLDNVIEVAEVQSNILSTGEDLAQVLVRKPVGEVVTVSVTSQDGQVLHVRRLGRGQTHYRLGYDLSALAEQSCSIEVRQNGDLLNQAYFAHEAPNVEK